MGVQGGRAPAREHRAQHVLRERGVAPRLLALADAGYANTAGTGACADLALRETARFEREWTAADGEAPDFRVAAPASLGDVVRVLARGGDARPFCLRAYACLCERK